MPRPFDRGPDPEQVALCMGIDQRKKNQLPRTNDHCYPSDEHAKNSDEVIFVRDDNYPVHVKF